MFALFQLTLLFGKNLKPELDIIFLKALNALRGKFTIRRNELCLNQSSVPSAGTKFRKRSVPPSTTRPSVRAVFIPILGFFISGRPVLPGER